MLFKLFHKDKISAKEKRQMMSHLAEFFFIGLMMGIIEDMLAIYFATDADITFRTFKVATMVAIPFAIISELAVDLKLFRKMFKRK